MCLTTWKTAIVGRFRKTPEYLENFKIKTQKYSMKIGIFRL